MLSLLIVSTFIFFLSLTNLQANFFGSLFKYRSSYREFMDPKINLRHYYNGLSRLERKLLRKMYTNAIHHSGVIEYFRKHVCDDKTSYSNTILSVQEQMKVRLEYSKVALHNSYYTLHRPYFLKSLEECYLSRYTSLNPYFRGYDISSHQLFVSDLVKIVKLTRIDNTLIHTLLYILDVTY
jgi:hypothetical protein